MEKGEKAKEREFIIEMLKDGTLTINKIASLAKVPVAYVEQLAEGLKK